MRLTGMKEYKIANEGVGRKFQVPSVSTFSSSSYLKMTLHLLGSHVILTISDMKILYLRYNPFAERFDSI